MLHVTLQCAPFGEHPIADFTVFEPHEFDIIAFHPSQPSSFIINGQFALQQYCRCLLHKLFTLTKSQVKPFIQYQCSQLAQPVTWLNKLEKLIDLNRDLFTTSQQKLNVEKALAVIELLRDKLENSKAQKSFDFDLVKQKTKAYATPEEKLSYLMEAKTEYLQNKPALVNPGEVSFDQKIDLEINLLKSQQKLSRKRREAFTGQEEKSPLGPLKKSALGKAEGPPIIKNKFKINTNLNKFVDIFYQLMHEKKSMASLILMPRRTSSRK